MNTVHDRSWEQTFSDMVYWTWHGEPPAWAVPSAVGFMERVLDLRKGAKVLDLGCAFAYHSIELVRRGYDVTGLEWSEPFLEEARRRAAEASVSVRLIHGDMTQMAFDKEFDAVVLWGNTFGMFSHEENVNTLRGIKRALKKGGLALIDTQNYTGLHQRLKNEWDFDGEQRYIFLEKGTRDVRKARFGTDVLAIDLASGTRHKMSLSWRLYLLPELENILKEVGLSVLGLYGDDPKFVDWKNWRRGEPDPYSVEGFTDSAAKRILLCQA